MPKNKEKTVEVVVRGTVIRVSESFARELREQERKNLQEDWNKNRLP